MAWSQRVWLFSRFGLEKRYRLWPFCSQIGCGFRTLVLNWVGFLQEATYLVIINKTINKRKLFTMLLISLAELGN